MGDTDKVDGFYVAFVTGTGGQGIALFVFRDGVVVGSDMAGVKYDGSYRLIDGGLGLEVTARVRAPGGVNLVQGRVTPPEGYSYSLTIRVPLGEESSFFRVETPLGPVNAKLVKLRGLVAEH